MNYIEIIMIIFILVGLIVGWSKGFWKTGTDLLAIFISMVIASILKKPLAILLMKILPFIEFGKDIYSLNILFYYIIAYYVIFLLIMVIYQAIMIRTGLDEKLVEKGFSSSILSKSISSILGLPFMIIVLYNLLLIVNFPYINVKAIDNSNLIDRFFTKTLILNNTNASLYLAEENASEYLHKSLYKRLSNKEKDNIIIYEFYLNDLVDSDTISTLKKQKKIKKDVTKIYNEREDVDEETSNGEEDKNDEED